MTIRTNPLVRGAFALLLGLSVAESAAAQHVYPAKGQSPETQQKDEADCYGWAVQQSGFDPAHPPAAATAQPAPVTGSGTRVKGAAVGAAAGSFSGNAGQGAAAGAVTGGVVQRNRNRQTAAAQNNAQAQQISAGQTSFNNARAACLTGKGYTVK